MRQNQEAQEAQGDHHEAEDYVTNGIEAFFKNEAKPGIQEAQGGKDDLDDSHRA